MKKLFLLIAVCSLLIACNNDNKSKESGSQKEAEVMLRDGWAIGKGSEYMPKTKAEENLISQSNTYCIAMMAGNVDEMRRFFYKESLEYYKKYYPGMSNEKIMDEMLSMIAEYSKIIRQYEEQGIEMSMYINDIVRKVEFGNDYLYVYGVCNRIEGYDTIEYIHSTKPDMTLGVSHNKGKHWTFMAMTDEVPSVLRLHYPQKIIDEVMGY